MNIHKLIDENGEIIHSCAVGSFPLPKDHWIYAEPVEPEPFLEFSRDIQEKLKEALRYTIQMCTVNGTDMDFDPDAMWLTFRETLFEEYQPHEPHE